MEKYSGFSVIALLDKSKVNSLLKSLWLDGFTIRSGVMKEISRRLGYPQFPSDSKKSEDKKQTEEQSKEVRSIFGEYQKMFGLDAWIGDWINRFIGKGLNPEDQNNPAVKVELEEFKKASKTMDPKTAVSALVTYIKSIPSQWKVEYQSRHAGEYFR